MHVTREAALTVVRFRRGIVIAIVHTNLDGSARLTASPDDSPYGQSVVVGNIRHVLECVKIRKLTVLV